MHALLFDRSMICKEGLPLAVASVHTPEKIKIKIKIKTICIKHGKLKEVKERVT